MSKDKILERFAEIIRIYGSINSGFYDSLTIENKPPRTTLRQYFGNWKEAVETAKKYLKEQGVRIEEKEETICDVEQPPSEEVLRLTQQVQELTRHLHTTQLHLDGTVHKFGFISDTHIGSLYADMPLLETAYNIFEEEGIKTVFHAGDLLDGMKVYRGQEFETFVSGVDGQIGLVIDKYPKKKGLITYFITGNHDRSFWKLCGVEVGEKITLNRPDLIHLGYQEANITIGEGDCTATVRLFHPEDGSAYAYSYKVQKYLEALPSGTKPDICLVGHYHKMELLIYRGVVACQGGTLQQQTPFMRGRKISAAVGFWILDVVVGPNRIVSVTSKFYPVRS